MITLKLSKLLPDKLPKCITRYNGKTEYHYVFEDDAKLRKCLYRIIRDIQK